jgi:hypothetical protein
MKGLKVNPGFPSLFLMSKGYNMYVAFGTPQKNNRGVSQSAPKQINYVQRRSFQSLLKRDESH